MNSENSEPKVLKAGIFKIISLKVYPMTLFLSIGQTDEELKKCARKHFKLINGFIEDSFKDWEENPGIKARVLMHSSGDSIMRFRTGREIPNTIAHECFHIVNHVMTTIGGPLTESSEESWAYLLGYLVEEVTNEFRALAAKNNIEEVTPKKLAPVLELVPINTK